MSTTTAVVARAAAALADEEFTAIVEIDDYQIAGGAAFARALGVGAQVRLGPDGQLQLPDLGPLPFAVQVELEWLKEDVRRFLAPRADTDTPPSRKRYRVRGGGA
jgi:hypothetical protein